MKKVTGMLAVVTMCGSLLVSEAEAALISKDLKASSDGLLTLDTDTQLEWLDLTATNGISVVNIFNGYGNYIDDGFRYATHNEVLSLYLNAGITGFDSSPFYRTDSIEENYFVVEDLINLMGCTSRCENTPDSWPYGHMPVLAGTYGADDSLSNFENRFFGSSYISYQISSINFPEYNGTGKAAIGNRSNHASGEYDGYGSFLVRSAVSVPEPSTLVLLGIGIFGVVASSGKKGRIKFA